MSTAEKPAQFCHVHGHSCRTLQKVLGNRCADVRGCNMPVMFEIFNLFLISLLYCGLQIFVLENWLLIVFFWLEKNPTLKSRGGI